jgi:hypothetical protein
MLPELQLGGALRELIRKLSGKVTKSGLPDGRKAAKEWLKKNPGKSLKGTPADFEVSWANWLRKKGLTNQNPGKVRNIDVQRPSLDKFSAPLDRSAPKKHGGSVGPNGIL